MDHPKIFQKSLKYPCPYYLTSLGMIFGIYNKEQNNPDYDQSEWTQICGLWRPLLCRAGRCPLGCWMLLGEVWQMVF